VVGRDLSSKQSDELLAAFKARSDANQARHPGLVWTKVQARLGAAHPQAAYFNVGRIGDDQIADWAKPMAMEEAEARRGLASVG